ncbi:glycoside hydrolase family 65 protein [Fervidobacterium sp. 2310opik-2]|uniref:glycoside hydrolase family 65 protein n=1 Tax=Fervidobacterium sp. 2310opik-2 TaxID=1755815 RepID=UPI0013E08EE9|nr:glycoside hydrolase family 65 protein [Fervidobacterium sp. 2310opik-2]KAF2962430.1 kojibiose phosphorylase [Fervidobacterium sp. 2310opik-2]
MWDVVRNSYSHSDNYVYETLFTLANGYLSLRGIEEFSNYKMKGTYIAGIFDKSEAQVVELVNLPDPLAIRIYVDGVPLNLDSGNVLDYQRKLDMKRGLLISNYTFKVSEKIISIESKRFVSRANIHRFGVKYVITPVNFSGKIIVENCIDTNTFNGLLDPLNKVQHYKVKEIKDIEPGVGIIVKTNDKGHEIAFATILVGKDLNGENVLRYRKYRQITTHPTEIYTIFVTEGKSFTLEKYGSVYTSMDTKDAFKEVRCEVEKFIVEGLENEITKHINIMEDVWNRIDIVIENDELAQQGIRFNLFHLYSCAPDNPKVSIGARGLHGEGYKGHVFWDTEIFMFPFYLYALPEYAKNLLLYRYNTLPGARRNAQMNGYKGAQFPWESADDGTEVTPKWGEDYLGNPVRIWTGDEEYHINADIAVALIHYFVVTGDEEFMKDYGVEILLETGRFWASRVEYNEKYDRYEINRVIGPDEFHEHVNNNVYTNYLAKWNMLKAVEFYKWLKEKDIVKFERLKTHLGLTDEEVESWKGIAEKIYIPRKKGEKLIEQFEGYFDLEEHVITEWDENGLPKWPKTVDLTKLGETKLIKQPDVVMLMLVLPEEFTQEEMKINYEYYEKRTMHKSSLSPSMYSIMGLKVGDTHNAYKYFMKTVLVDLEDNQGNTNNGFHAASAGGAWQCVVNGFGGMTLNSEGMLEFNPWLPEHWKKLKFNINYRKNAINIEIRKEGNGMVLEINSTGDFEVIIHGKKQKITAGKNVFNI